MRVLAIEGNLPVSQYVSDQDRSDLTLPLKDRVIIVVGGTTGLGLSAAAACVQAGGRVIACGLDQESVVRTQELLGDQVRIIVSDATDPQTAPRLVSLAQSEFGRLDALYHVAGGSGRKFGDGPLHEISVEAIQKTLELNLNSLILSNRSAVQYFLRNKVSGSILNLSSVLAEHPSPKYFATHVYAAAKSAIIGFTKSCAAYYADQGIRLNVLAPSLVETPMSQRAMQDSRILAFARSKQPLASGRILKPEDLDAAVVYFLSEQARMVTGQVLSIDAGWSLMDD